MNNKIVVAVKGIVINKSRILLLKRSENDPIGPDSWEYVGGKINFDESLEEALKREAFEEAGIEIDIIKILYATTFKTSEFRKIILLTYLCYSKKREVQLSHEHKEYIWVKLNEAKKILPKHILKDMENNSAFRQITKSGKWH